MAITSETTNSAPADAKSNTTLGLVGKLGIIVLVASVCWRAAVMLQIGAPASRSVTPFKTGLPVDTQVGRAWLSMRDGGPSYYQYNTSRFGFENALREIFDDFTGPLDELHTFFVGADAWPLATLDNDTNTMFHSKYYKSDKYEDFQAIYRRFVREFILPLFDEREFAVQREPSFRVHLPNNSALGVRSDEDASLTPVLGMHSDSFYSHPSGEMNFMVSFTPMYESNSCFTESQPGEGDFSPITMTYGNVYRFYGNKCRHYNTINRTGKTRVSIDFRVIPFSQYDDAYTGKALHSDRPFRIQEDGYYMKMTV